MDFTWISYDFTQILPGFWLHETKRVPVAVAVLGISQVGVGGFVKRSDRVNARLSIAAEDWTFQLDIDAGFQFSKMGPVYMYNIIYIYILLH